MNPPLPKKIKIMGIVNCTPDSFSDGGKYIHEDSVKKRIDEMVLDEADLIDIGGESTRPGAQQITAEEEWKRIRPAILYCKKQYPSVRVSIDTYKSEVANKAIAEGADIINDISGGVLDKEMLPILSGRGVPIILMHIQGSPQTMQKAPVYSDVISEIKTYLNKQIEHCASYNVPVYALDPGIGFGKTPDHNRMILSNLESFTSFNLPLLIGVSRKSVFKHLFDLEVTERDIPSAILESMLVFKGASIIRTHNTRNGRYIRELFTYLRSSDV